MSAPENLDDAHLPAAIRAWLTQYEGWRRLSRWLVWFSRFNDPEQCADFRRLFIEGVLALHQAGELAFFGDHEGLVDTAAFNKWLAPFRKTEWVVYAKPPFGGPEAVLAYLSRYTHRVAISNHRLVSADADTVTFHWKDYRVKYGDRQKIMRLATPEFIRRFLMHVLPDGFHRIRHYGLLASATRKANIACIRDLLRQQAPEREVQKSTEPASLTLREPREQAA